MRFKLRLKLWITCDPWVCLFDRSVSSGAFLHNQNPGTQPVRFDALLIYDHCALSILLIMEAGLDLIVAIVSIHRHITLTELIILRTMA